MEQARNNYRVASIINIIIGATSFLFLRFYGTLLFIIGVILYLYSKESDEQLKDNKTLFTVIGVILIPLNFLSSIFVFIGNSTVDDAQRINGANGPPIRIKRIIDPEYKKVDILLKIGVLMVFISGILFATNSWDFISDFLKIIILLALGGLFLCLSIFTERNLKLYRSSYMYWILSMSFFMLSIVSTLYFGIFSSELTYIGSARSLSFFITFTTMAGLSYATYLKFPKKYLLYITYTSVLFLISNLLLYFIEDISIITIVISTISLVIIAINKKETSLSYFLTIVSLSLFPFILSGKDVTIAFIAAILNIILLNYITVKYKSAAEAITSLFIIYLLTIVSVAKLELGEMGNLIIFILLTVNTLLIRFNIIKINSAHHNVNYILYMICSLFIMCIEYKATLLPFLIGIVCILLNILEQQDSELPKISYARWIEPLLILITTIIFLSMDIIPFEIKTTTKIIITTLIFCLTNYFATDEKLKTTYFVSVIISLLVYYIAENSYGAEKDVIASIIAILVGAYLYYLSDNTNKKKEIKSIAFIVFMVQIYNALFVVNAIGIELIYNVMIAVSVLALYIVLSKNNTIKTISYFLMVVPLYRLLDSLGNSEFRGIALSFLGLYVTFLILKFLVIEKEPRSILGVIGIVTSLLLIMDFSSVYVGIYIGIVGLAVIIIGYYRNELKYFFTTGIVITIVNIIYQLKDFWHLVPFWLYLLVGGLGLIGFVTYKEINKNNKK